MSTKTVKLRFYEELNDFLESGKKKKAFFYQFSGKHTIKHVIEALGVPHTEVELILANGDSVGFDYHIKDGDHISVYPVFETFDVSPLIRLREKPLRNIKFILDVHLGKLAKILRMLGFDTFYKNDYNDREIINISKTDNRIILTSDCGILKNKSVTHGCYIRSEQPYEQAQEVLQRFDLFSQIKTFHRCMICNGVIESVSKESILSEIPPKTAKYYKKFYKCSDCGKIYWKGSHYFNMKEKIEQIYKFRHPDLE
jgi:uncharacterized protein with PIN domain